MKGNGMCRWEEERTNNTETRKMDGRMEEKWWISGMQDRWSWEEDRTNNTETRGKKGRIDEKGH